MKTLRYFKLFVHLKEMRLDLGIKNLMPEWRGLFQLKAIPQDLLAGIVVSLAAIPLSLAIAVGAKVDPTLGLISAVCAGVLCALFGGSRLAISGPANSMLVLIALIVERTGVEGLLFVTLLCGVVQLLAGMFGFGKFVRFIPLPLVAGFTAGMGVIILVNQLPRALGLPVPESGDIYSVLSHLSSLLHESQPRVVLLAFLAIGITQIVPRLHPKLPGSFFAILIPAILVQFSDWEVPLLGELNFASLSLTLPKFPLLAPGWELFELSLLLVALASLESRLTVSAIDKLIPGEKNDPDQDLIGQGLANTAAAFLGGIPVTGVIARTALNIRAGAKTRRASIFHAGFILLMILLLGRFLAFIPLAALSGVLLSIALNMVRPREVVKIWRTSPVESIIYWITFLTVVLVDLMAGVQMGIFAAILIALWNLGQAKLFFHTQESQETLRVSLSGNITFLSSRNLELLSKRIQRASGLKAVVIDLSEVKLLDATGASLFLEFVKACQGRGVEVILKSLNRQGKEVLGVADNEGISKALHVSSEHEIATKLRMGEKYDPKEKLLFGIERYRNERKKAYEELFDQLGKQQNPHTLFITCSDSRINPSLITSSEPGELFVVRNVGNIIPPPGADELPAEGAAIEFSLGALGVEEIIICGHTQCGAIKGAFHGLDANQFPSVAKWVEPISRERKAYPEITTPEDFVRIHVLEQAKNILAYPIVRKKMAEGKVALHCWVYDVGEGEFLEWTGEGHEFVKVGPHSLHGKIQALLSATQSDY